MERLVGSLDDVDRSDLAAFTIVLGAVGLGGIDAAVAAATEARRQVERLRQRTKRAGLDLSYWGQIELAFATTPRKAITVSQRWPRLAQGVWSSTKCWCRTSTDF